VGLGPRIINGIGEPFRPTTGQAAAARSPLHPVVRTIRKFPAARVVGLKVKLERYKNMSPILQALHSLPVPHQSCRNGFPNSPKTHYICEQLSSWSAMLPISWNIARLRGAKSRTYEDGSYRVPYTASSRSSNNCCS
jgi:hypothetical protein